MVRSMDMVHAGQHPHGVVVGLLHGLHVGLGEHGDLVQGGRFPCLFDLLALCHVVTLVPPEKQPQQGKAAADASLARRP